MFDLGFQGTEQLAILAKDGEVEVVVVVRNGDLTSCVNAHANGIVGDAWNDKRGKRCVKAMHFSSKMLLHVEVGRGWRELWRPLLLLLLLFHSNLPRTGNRDVEKLTGGGKRWMRSGNRHSFDGNGILLRLFQSSGSFFLFFADLYFTSVASLTFAANLSEVSTLVVEDLDAMSAIVRDEDLLSIVDNDTIGKLEMLGAAKLVQDVAQLIKDDDAHDLNEEGGE